MRGYSSLSVKWSCHKNFSQWGRSFHWKLRCHWLKCLRQRQIAVVIQGPGSLCWESGGLNNAKHRSLPWCLIGVTPLYHRPLHCFFPKLLRIPTKKYWMSALLAICERNPPMIGIFPSQRGNYLKSVFMSWWRHGCHGTHYNIKSSFQ